MFFLAYFSQSVYRNETLLKLAVETLKLYFVSYVLLYFSATDLFRVLCVRAELHDKYGLR